MAWLLFVLQYLAAPVLIAWHAWRVEPSVLVWTTRTLAVGAYVVAVALVGVWLLVPWYVAWLLLVPWAAASLFSWWRRNARVTPRTLNATRWFRFAAYSALLVASLVLIAQAFRAHQPYLQPAADVSFPLRGGTYYVANAGSNSMLSSHLMTLAPKVSKYRAQSYAVDLVKLNAAGHHARTLFPNTLDDYEIFGEPVYAPCTGEVRLAESNRPDFLPPDRDRAHLEGNFVLLNCGSFDVFMGHFAKGSVTVKPGDRVREGHVLGRVGNSGNTDLPHLHIHAQVPGAAFPTDADPLPITFDGKHYARNDRILAPEAQPAPGVARW